ncbi:MAG: DNA recombination protein RmuC, partial [Rhizobiales bacterium]|nr:DNA recombination protein RmuC [Hyphomicrobiales bacterium]
MQQILLVVAGRPITLAEALLGGAGLALLLFALLLLVQWRAQARRSAAEAEQRLHGEELELRIAELIRLQSEMTGRMQTMAEVFGSRQSDMVRSLADRLDGFGHRIGQSMSETSRNTHEGLSRLNERLAVIDSAQRNITELSSQVVGLQQILANKQSRGAFGQGRMEAIVQDGLPVGGYAFQATLSNGNRPDCVIAF